MRDAGLGAKLNLSLLAFFVVLGAATSAVLIYGSSRTQDSASERSTEALAELASLALGAEGVWCGSVWLTTQEAETSDVIRQKFVDAPSSGTVRSRSLTGKPARMIRTDWTDAWESEQSPGPLGMPLQSFLVSEAQRRIARVAAKDEGARRLSTSFVGQIVGSMTSVRPAASVVLDMVDEFIDAVQRLDTLMES